MTRLRILILTLSIALSGIVTAISASPARALAVPPLMTCANTGCLAGDTYCDYNPGCVCSFDRGGQCTGEADCNVE